MTPEEHKMMLMLFAQQNAKFEILFQLLEDRKVIEPDDLLAYHALIFDANHEGMPNVVRAAWEQYQSAAQTHGVTTGLENWLPPEEKAK